MANGVDGEDGSLAQEKKNMENWELGLGISEREEMQN